MSLWLVSLQLVSFGIPTTSVFITDVIITSNIMTSFFITIGVAPNSQQVRHSTASFFPSICNCPLSTNRLTCRQQMSTYLGTKTTFWQSKNELNFFFCCRLSHVIRQPLKQRIGLGHSTILPLVMLPNDINLGMAFGIIFGENSNAIPIRRLLPKIFDV